LIVDPVETAPMPGEKYSDQEDESEESDAGDDDDILLPDAPPPGAGDDSDDDIELPEGPPPGQVIDSTTETPPLPPALPLLPTGYSTATYLPPRPFISQAPVFYSPRSNVASAAATQIQQPAPVRPAHLPPKPSTPSASAVISAEPELRDLRKESTAFIPSALKRKKPAAAKVDSRPDVGASESKPTPSDERPDLVKTLQSRLGQSAGKS